MKIEIKPHPYLKDMTYDEKSYLMIDCRTGDSPYVVFYNPTQDKKKEFANLNEFAVGHIEDAFSHYDDSKIDYNSSTATASGCSSREVEEMDENSGKSFIGIETKGQIIKVMTNIKPENINDEIKKVAKELDNLENEVTNEATQEMGERKAPYESRGLRKSDFI